MPPFSNHFLSTFCGKIMYVAYRSELQMLDVLCTRSVSPCLPLGNTAEKALFSNRFISSLSRGQLRSLYNTCTIFVQYLYVYNCTSIVQLLYIYCTTTGVGMAKSGRKYCTTIVHILYNDRSWYGEIGAKKRSKVGWKTIFSPVGALFEKIVVTLQTENMA